MGARSVPLDQIDLWLDNNSADIAILITKTDNTIDCTPTSSINFGRIGGFAFSFDSSKPFATSTDTFALGDLTAIHELGHVMGGLHADTINPTIESFTAGLGAHGFENDNAGQWQTIMGGYSTSRCIFDIHNPVPQQDCTRIWYFSNPIMSAIVNGQAVYIGTSQNDGGSNGDGGQRIADMQSWLETSGMPIVSGYNTDIMPPSIAPNLNVQSEHCFGFNTASWNAISSADSYELYKSLSSSFTFPAKIFTGTSLVTTVNVPQGQTWYLRVKACNAGGCSGFSNQRAASAIASCL